MDGTLVDSTQVVEDLWSQFANLYGLPLSEILAYSHGRQTRDTVTRFLPAGNDVEEVVADIQAVGAESHRRNHRDRWCATTSRGPEERADRDRDLGTAVSGRASSGGGWP